MFNKVKQKSNFKELKNFSKIFVEFNNIWIKKKYFLRIEEGISIKRTFFVHLKKRTSIILKFIFRRTKKS